MPKAYSKSLLINEGYIITGEENYSKNGKEKYINLLPNYVMNLSN